MSLICGSVTMNDSELGQLISLSEMTNLSEVLEALIPSPSIDDDDDKDLPVSAPPQQTDLMLPGLLGEISRTCCNKTEAVPIAVAANLLVWFMTHIGRLRYIMIGDDQQWLNNYFLLIGPSGMGKGVSGKAPYRIFKRVQEHLELNFKHAFDAGKGNGMKAYPPPNVHVGGLSSGEGLGFALDDGDNTSIPGRVIIDKRLLIIESEMANVLCQMSRQGNTLSVQLRNAYDGVDIRPMTKRDRVSVSDPYINVMGNITPDELLRFDDDKTQSFNGLLNRFLMLWTKPQKLVSRPYGLEQTQIDQFATVIAENVMLARNGHFEVHWKKIRTLSLPVDIDEDAWDLFDSVYSQLMNQPCSKRIASLIKRHRVHVLLMACALSLFEGLSTVSKGMMQAALEWIDYSRKSIVYCYNTHKEQLKSEISHAIARKVLYAIALISHKNGSCTRTDIYNFHQRKLRREQLTQALEILINWVPPLIEQDSKRLKSGRNVFVYLPTADAKNLVKAK